MANEFQQAPQQGYQQPQQPQQPQQGYYQQPQQQFNNMFNQGGGTPMMQIGDAVKRVLANLTNFNGRARRSEYWWAALCLFLPLSIIAYIVKPGLEEAWVVALSGSSTTSIIIRDILYRIIMIAGIAVLLAVNVRRLQDSNKPGIVAWIYAGCFAGAMIIGYFSTWIGVALLVIASIIGIVNIVLCCLDSQQGPNPHGPSEKYPM